MYGQTNAGGTKLTINRLSWSDMWEIAENTDLNDIKTVGTWVVPKYTIMVTLTNAPTTVAGTLTVSAPLSNVNVGTEISGVWQNIVQEFATWEGDVYRRACYSNGSGTWTYGAWRKVVLSTDNT